jgi:hypothetical protein
MRPYTYLIKFKPTGQFYYGSRFKNVRLGVNPEDDLMLHYTTSSDTINDLINEHGLDAFEWEVRKTFDTPKQAADWETRVLKRCKVLEDKKWLNGNIAGYIVPTEESCKKISDFHKDKPKSEEHKKNLSKSQKGKPKKSTVYQSQEYRQKMSQLKSGPNNGMYGKGCTEERARKIGEANKGKVPINKGVPMSEEQKAKIRETKAANPTKMSSEAIARRIEKIRGQKRPKLYCPHCKRDIAVGWYDRHGDNCKHNKRN